jgi:hypothetical protein
VTAKGAGAADPGPRPGRPPGNSLARDQRGRVASAGDDLAGGLRALLGRVAEELAYNDAKGSGPYRLGVHDGLRFAEDALVDLLRRHGHEVGPAPSRQADA